jgi:hypothetical protein
MLMFACLVCFPHQSRCIPEGGLGRLRLDIILVARCLVKSFFLRLLHVNFDILDRYLCHYLL